LNIKISIIVPCFNQAKFLDECLNSVLNQTYSNWECIIINDGSQDNTSVVANLWISKDSRFKYLFQENRGLSSARNLGIRNSNSDFLLPLDADDKISPNYIEECVKIILSSDTVKVAYGKGVKFGSINEDWVLPKYDFLKLLEKNMIFCTALFRKSDWEICNGYDEHLKEGFEDWEFWINILSKGGTAIQSQKCTFYYRIKSNSMSTELNSSEFIKTKNKKYIFQKHLPVFIPLYFDIYMEYLQLKEFKSDPLSHYSSIILLKKILNNIKIKFTGLFKF